MLIFCTVVQKGPYKGLNIKYYNIFKKNFNFFTIMFSSSLRCTVNGQLEAVLENLSLIFFTLFQSPQEMQILLL